MKYPGQLIGREDVPRAGGPDFAMWIKGRNGPKSARPGRAGTEKPRDPGSALGVAHTEYGVAHGRTVRLRKVCPRARQLQRIAAQLADLFNAEHQPGRRNLQRRGKFFEYARAQALAVFYLLDDRLGGSHRFRKLDLGPAECLSAVAESSGERGDIVLPTLLSLARHVCEFNDV